MGSSSSRCSTHGCVPFRMRLYVEPCVVTLSYRPSMRLFTTAITIPGRFGDGQAYVAFVASPCCRLENGAPTCVLLNTEKCYSAAALSLKGRSRLPPMPLRCRDHLFQVRGPRRSQGNMPRPEMATPIAETQAVDAQAKGTVRNIEESPTVVSLRAASGAFYEVRRICRVHSQTRSAACGREGDIAESAFERPKGGC